MGYEEAGRLNNEVLREIHAYIESHLDGEITLRGLSDAICYSQEHTSRFYKRMTGSGLFDYIRERRLLKAADDLRRGERRVIDVALSRGFDSHEGFTRAFSSYFGIPPRTFRKYKPEVKEFMPRGFKVFPIEGKEVFMDTLTVFTQVIEKPKRLLLLKRAEKAEEYFAYCEEIGCDIWGRLLEVENPLTEPVGLWMPEPFRPSGTSLYVQGVEVAENFNGRVPDGLDKMVLPASKYLLFHSEPYQEDDDTMMKVITQVKDSIAKYDPGLYGYEWAEDDGPRFQYTPLGERGYIEGLPVRSLSLN